MGLGDLFKRAKAVLAGGGDAGGGDPPARSPAMPLVGPEQVAQLSLRVANRGDAEILDESRRIAPLIAGILEAGGARIAPGVTTAAIARTLTEGCLAEDLLPAMLGFNGFPAAAAVSVNEEIVHGMPSQRAIVAGDLVKLELGVVSGKAFGAQSWTFPVHGISEVDQRLLATGRDALRYAIATMAPGSRLGDIGEAIQSTVEKGGFSAVRDYVGHGMGRRRFQPPQVSCVGKRGTGLRLRAGMILNLHVILKHGDFDVEVGDNGWTAVAADRRRGAIFTAMVEVTAEGHRVLTREVVT